MPSLEAMVRERVEITARRDAALQALAERSGVPVPELADAGRPKPMPAHMNGDLALAVFLLEQVQALATEIDALQAPRATKGRKS